MSHRDTEHLRVLIANERKDRLALVGLGESSQHALELIDQIVREAACLLGDGQARAREQRPPRLRIGVAGSGGQPSGSGPRAGFARRVPRFAIGPATARCPPRAVLPLLVDRLRHFRRRNPW